MPPSNRNPSEIATAAEKVLSTGRLFHTRTDPYFAPHTGPAVHVSGLAFRVMVAAICGTSPSSRKTRSILEFISARTFQVGEPVQIVRVNDAVAVVGGTPHYLFNAGGGQIIEIKPDATRSQIPNGTYGTLFIDPPGFEPVGLTEEHLLWDGSGDGHIVSLLISRLPPPPPGGLLTRREVAALILAAWLTPFLTSRAPGRPVWLFLGPPGAGKSSTQRVLAQAYYGSEGEVLGGGSDRAVKDLQAAAAGLPVIHMDDVTALSPEAIANLCRMSTGTKFALAQMYETLALAEFTVQTTITLSAYAPEWLRRLDLMSRLIPIEFAVPPTDSGLTQVERTREVLAGRKWIWAETLLVLAHTLTPPKVPCPIRFDDWHKHLHAILSIYRLASEFRSALSKLKSECIRIACGADAEMANILAVARDPWCGLNWWPAAWLAERLSRNDGVQPREHEPHLAPNLVRDPRSVAKLLQTAKTKHSGVVTIVVRSGPNHANEYRMWPADQPDPLEQPPLFEASPEARE